VLKSLAQAALQHIPIETSPSKALVGMHRVVFTAVVSSPLRKYETTIVLFAA